MAERKLHGAVPDPPDARDFPATRLLVREVALPKSYRVNPSTIIYDQNGYPACVGYATAGAKTDEEYLEHGKQLKFDGLGLYNKCKLEDGIPNLDGTYPRTALKILKRDGIAMIPANTSCPFAFLKPKPPAPAPDIKWNIDGYFRIATNSTIDFIKQIIFQFGSIIAACTWYPNWDFKFKIFPYPEGSSNVGHCFRIEGWEEDVGLALPNSWGKILWGINGISYMPEQMFMSVVLPEADVWKMVDHLGETL